MEADFEKYTFDYCVKYREDQNRKIGSLLVALLNGNRVEDDRLKKLEEIVPRLSFRMQVIDDIGDLEEDLRARRPSYAVGALQEHPEEMERIMKLTTVGKVKKVTPSMLEIHAPKSYILLINQYKKYGKELEDEGVNGKFLKDLGDLMFSQFPKARDFIYNYINKKWANF